MVWPDGSVHYVRAIRGDITLDARGNVLQLSGVVQDITDRRLQDLERDRLLRQLEDKAEQLAQVMRSVPEGVLLLDNLRHVLLANPRAEEMLARLAEYDAGQQLRQLGGTPLDDLLTSPPLGRWHTVQEGRRLFELAVRPVEAGPLPAGWVLVLRDVTAERAVQEQLQRQERLAAVGQLAAGIAHDFNNIMSVISIYAELTSEAPGLTDKERMRTLTIIEQARRATRMIRQILDFSRQSVFERQVLDLLSLLKEEVKLLRQTLPENIEVELAAARGEYLVKADPTRMQQLIVNLAVNARDAMPEGGRLRIELAQRHIDVPDTVLFPGMKAGEWLQVSVGDTGSGIAPAHLAQIFEPFFTTKEPGKGTGLGLAQVHGIVAQHDGYITATSEVGAGAVFSIYLPAEAAVGGPSTAVAAQVALPQGHGELVLIVEDSPALRASLVELLEMWNYRVAQAANGEEALANLAQWGEVAVIVSDVIMPQLGGIGLVKALRSAGGVTPVILMSGHIPDEDRLGLKEAGVVAWLDKPPSAWLLAKAIAEALRRE